MRGFPRAHAVRRVGACRGGAQASENPRHAESVSASVRPQAAAPQLRDKPPHMLRQDRASVFSFR
jgi:hypothetical protein